MKFLFDLFPVVLFFVAIQIWDIFVATAVAIVATFLQVGWLKLRAQEASSRCCGRASPSSSVFGGADAATCSDKTFIMWKPTVLYWLFGVGARRRARCSAAT